MKTKCFELELNNETATIIRTIALCVPCFINLTDKGATGEYTITARVEDWAWIERKLSSIV